MKKVIYSSLLLALFVVAVLLTGCGDKANAGMKTENNQANRISHNTRRHLC